MVYICGNGKSESRVDSQTEGAAASGLLIFDTLLLPQIAGIAPGYPCVFVRVNILDFNTNVLIFDTLLLPQIACIALVCTFFNVNTSLSNYPV